MARNKPGGGQQPSGQHTVQQHVEALGMEPPESAAPALQGVVPSSPGQVWSWLDSMVANGQMSVREARQIMPTYNPPPCRTIIVEDDRGAGRSAAVNESAAARHTQDLGGAS